VRHGRKAGQESWAAVGAEEASKKSERGPTIGVVRSAVRGGATMD
jgi:hypothetical protein